MTFRGFPPAGFQFLADIRENNNREWFQANKQIYQEALIDPAVAFITSLGERLQQLSPNIQYDTRTNGAGSLTRIYRDTRFSKDKSPYKDWLGMVFWQGQGKKTENPAFYFGLSAEGAGIHVGMHGFPSNFMQAYRTAVNDQTSGEKLAQILHDITTAGYQINGEQYKRVPRGYEQTHPRSDLLRYKGLYASVAQLPTAVVSTPALVDVCFEHCQQLAPLQQWLVARNS